MQQLLELSIGIVEVEGAHRGQKLVNAIIKDVEVGEKPGEPSTSFLAHGRGE